MAIQFHKTDQRFVLHTKNTTYAFEIAKGRYLRHLYYGKRRETFVSEEPPVYGFSAFRPEFDFHWSPDIFSQEISFFGSGDFRADALRLCGEDGTGVTDFVYGSYRVFNGRRSLDGLPASRADADTQTLEIEMTEFGVECRYIKKNTQPTGQCFVTLDEAGIPHYNVLCDVAYDGIALDGGDFSRIAEEGYDALYFGTLIQRETASRKAVRDLVATCHFPTVICDVNLRPNCYDSDSVKFCLRNASVLKVSMEEEPLLRAFGGYTPADDSPRAVALALCESYPQLEVVLVTLGKDGSYAYTAKEGREFRQKSIGDTVVSTVGAGDSFAAAWLVSYLNQKPIAECMRRAAEVSGFVVAHTQAVPRY